MGTTEVEQGALTDQDIARLTLFKDDQVVGKSGVPHPLYRMKRYTTSPIGLPEWLSHMSMMSPWKMASGQGQRELAGMSSPFLQSAAIVAQGRKLDRTFSTAQTNMVPPILLEGPFGEKVMEWFGIGPEPLEPGEDPSLAQEEATRLLGTPARWTAGGQDLLEGNKEAALRHRAAFQHFMIWLGRPIDQLQTLGEATGMVEPPPHMTDWDSTLELLTGIRTRPVLHEDEVLRRRGEQQVRELRSFASPEHGLGLPPGIGPR
jgi:hypothetical protein